MAPSHSFRICDRPRIVTRSEQRQGIESLLSEASKSLEKYGLQPQEACHTRSLQKSAAQALRYGHASARILIMVDRNEHGAADKHAHSKLV